jgi:hypothetical protein
MGNGRISNLEGNNLISYDFFNETRSDPNAFRTQAIKNIHSESRVSNLFFSKENMDILQDGIRFVVFKKTKEVISKQSEPELQVIMRSIYLQYAKNLNTNIIEQVKDLNSKVLDYTVSYIANQIHNYKIYTNDITNMPIPLERSKNMSSAGTKNLFRAET